MKRELGGSNCQRHKLDSLCKTQFELLRIALSLHDRQSIFYHASECLSIQEATFGWHLFHTLQKDCWLEWLYKVEEFWSGILSTFVQNKQQVFVGIQIWCLQVSTYSKSLSFQVAHECKSFTSIALGWIPVKTCEKHSYHLHGSTIYMEVVQETCLNSRKKLRPILFALFCFVKVLKPGSF